MKSPAPAQLVHARVMHARLRPVLHRFVYPVFYVRLNLAQLERCQSRWFGVDRPPAVTAHARDYGPRDGSSLEHWMRALLASTASRPMARSGCRPSRACSAMRSTPSASGTAMTAKAACAPCWPRSTTPSAKPTATCCRCRARARHVHQADARVAVLPADRPLPFPLPSTGAQPRTSLDYHDDDGLLIRTTLSGRAGTRDSALAAALLRYPLLTGHRVPHPLAGLAAVVKRVPFRQPPAVPPPTSLSTRSRPMNRTLSTASRPRRPAAVPGLLGRSAMAIWN
jgi:hypothetical protein